MHRSYTAPQDARSPPSQDDGPVHEPSSSPTSQRNGSRPYDRSYVMSRLVFFTTSISPIFISLSMALHMS